ncbi:MAG: ABC transporter permease, partial [Bacteroidetes bacterium]|nr:ABC transporter permease [Bacteroidota bacterium]
MENDSEKWDLVLRPKNKWYEIDIKGVWHYRDLVMLFVRRDFLTAYKQTILGPLWMVLQPLVMTLMFSVIFGRIANIPTGGVPRLLYYLAAFVPWTYFSECLNKSATTFTANAGIFGKVYFPRLVSPISGMISNLFKYSVQLLLFVVIYFIFLSKGLKVSPNYHVVFIPILLIILAGFGLAFGLIITSVTTKYRDLTFLVGVGLQMLMYGSSVVISFSSFGPSLQKYLRL